MYLSVLITYSYDPANLCHPPVYFFYQSPKQICHSYITMLYNYLAIEVIIIMIPSPTETVSARYKQNKNCYLTYFTKLYG